MNPTEEACVDLIRELREAAQLQHASIMKIWQQEQGPHPAAAMLLSEIARQGELRMSELAKLRMVDISVVSRQVGQLAEAGLITRRPAPEDGRASLVAVSEEGERALARWRRLYVDFARTAFAGWSEDEVAHLVAQLRAANASIREVVGSEAGCAERPASGDERR